MPPELDQPTNNPSQPATQLPEDVTGLKNTIATLRQELKDANDRAKAFEGIDPAAARNALEQVPQLTQEKETLQSQLSAAQVDVAATEVLSNVLPQYRPIVAAAVRQQLQTEGATTETVSQTLRDQYPNLVVAAGVPVGSGASGTAPAAPPPVPTVQAQNGIIQGVDPQAIVKGEVAIQHQ